MGQFNQYFLYKLTLAAPLVLFEVVFSLASGLVAASESRVLLLSEVVETALVNDSVVMLNETRAQSAAENAIADGELADPKLTLGMFNVPASNFGLNQNPTTQLRLGIKQALPKGRTLRFQSSKRHDLSKAHAAQALLVSKAIARDVRQHYLEAFYQEKVAGELKSSRKLFTQLLKNTEDNYSLGGASQQVVLQAKLELSRLDDRMNQALNQQEASKAMLSKWVPEVMVSSLEKQLPSLPKLDIKSDIQSRLASHPQIIVDNAFISAAKHGVLIAKEQHKPSVNIGIEYRKRFGNELSGQRRDDLMAATLTLDMPLFTGNRQGRRLSASQFDLQSAKLMRDEHLKVLNQQLNRYFINWQRLKERESLYRQRLLPDAAENTKASLQAYQSKVIELSTLIQSYIAEFETRISSWRVSVNRAKAHTELLYLSTIVANKKGESHE